MGVKKSMKVCIDPGHGGRDPGAVGLGGTREADITLLAALSLKVQLEALGHTVILTRDDTTALHKEKRLDLVARAKVANDAMCDCFISIHCNAAEDRSANGSETWHHPRSAEGKRLAKTIQTALVSAGGLRNRGIKQSAGLAVLRLTTMPAVLIELGFISNPEEEKLLSNPKWLQRVVKAIAYAVDEWEKNDKNA